MASEEELTGWCDGCNTFRKLYNFFCRVCKNEVNYCETCLSVASKQNKCIDCYEEEG